MVSSRSLIETRLIEAQTLQALLMMRCLMANIDLSYEALALRLGITTASARRLVLRKRWAKTTGKDGRTLVQVPLEFLSNREPVTDLPAVAPDEPQIGPLQAKIDMLQARIEELKAEVNRERSERYKERERSDRLARELADLLRRRSGLFSWFKR